METLTVDAEIPVKFLTPDLQKTVDLFEPYGEGNAPLVFLTRAMRVLTASSSGERTSTT